MIDTLLIDLDNTILDFNKAEGPALAGALRTWALSLRKIFSAATA